MIPDEVNDHSIHIEIKQVMLTLPCSLKQAFDNFMNQFHLPTSSLTFYKAFVYIKTQKPKKFAKETCSALSSGVFTVGLVP